MSLSFNSGSKSPPRSPSPISPGRQMKKPQNNFLVKIFFPFCVVLVILLVYFMFRLNHAHDHHHLAITESINKKKNSDQTPLNKESIYQFTKRWLIYQSKISNDEYFKTNVSTQSYLTNNFQAFTTSSIVNIWDIYPPTISCPDIVRLGKVGEGGKWICGLSQLSTEPECVIYSFGISTDISFEIELLLSTNCRIHAFDPTVGKLPLDEFKSNISLMNIINDRIEFHKIALSNFTGGSSIHLLNEQLSDIMYGLNHSFVKLMKIDIEGGEWSVFRSIFDSHNKKSLPIGELLIELHYNNNDEMKAFFDGMNSHGFLPFSREINLQPAIAGNMPVASEYSFINPEHFYFQTPVPAINPPHVYDNHNMKNSRIKALIYFLTQKARTEMMGEALQNLYNNYWKFYPYYPVIIFHDDLTKQNENYLQQTVPNMKLIFKTISFTIPTFLNNLKIPDRTVCAPATSTIGYRHMCRFHATQVHQYLKTEGYGNYEYVMRLDDDSQLTYPIGYDLFKLMKNNNKLYGYVNIADDDPICVTGLWKESALFLNKTGIKPRKGNFFHEWREPAVFYNNFEISHMSLWKSSFWQKYMDYIDHIGGIYQLRWGDAPIHTIAISLMLLPSETHAFSDIGYIHKPFVNQLPSGLPMPLLDEVFDRSNIKCSFYDGWNCNTYNNHNNYSFYNQSFYNASFSIYNNTKNTLLNQKRILELIDNTRVKSKSYSSYNNNIKSVFYTFGVKGREMKIAYSIANIYEIITPPLVSPMNNYNDKYSKCIPESPEMRQVSDFLVRNASDILSSLGYEWFARFGDDFSFLNPIKYDIFHHLMQNNKVYGYVSTVELIGSTCIDELWSYANDLCNNNNNNSKDNNDSSINNNNNNNCPSNSLKWYPSQSFLTVFEVSHYSVWNSDLCSILFLYNNNNQGWYSESLYHTVCVIKSLAADSIQQFDIKMRFGWNNKLEEVHYVKDFGKILANNDYISTPIEDYNNIFSAQRIGFLGGDIASSIPLPNRRNVSQRSDMLIWLYGDSFIGVSTKTRRIRDYSKMVSNTIGVSKLAPDQINNNNNNHFSSVRNILNHKYYWKTNSEGDPKPIFEFDLKCEINEKEGFWPLFGLSVIIPPTDSLSQQDSTVKLIITGNFVCIIDSLNGNKDNNEVNSLSFYQKQQLIIIVDNPYDPPDIWTYRSQPIPNSISNVNNHNIL
eukprot:gene13005-17435_t